MQIESLIASIRKYTLQNLLIVMKLYKTEYI